MKSSLEPKEVKNETQTKNIKDVSWEAAVLKKAK